MRKICFLSDGTWFGKAQDGNVYKLYQQMIKNCIISYYDSGVGTEGCFCMRLLGGICGTFLEKNVIDGYKFLSQNVKTKNDEICLIGFSRGVFTVRSLCGMLDVAGLAENCTTNMAENAFRAYLCCICRRKYCF